LLTLPWSRPWPESVKKLHAAWWEARGARQKEIDSSIGAKAECEYLYDKSDFFPAPALQRPVADIGQISTASDGFSYSEPLHRRNDASVAHCIHLILKPPRYVIVANAIVF